MGVKKSANDMFVDVRPDRFRDCYANVQIFWEGMEGFLKMGGDGKIWGIVRFALWCQLFKLEPQEPMRYCHCQLPTVY